MILNFQNMKKTSCELATCFYIHIKLFLLHIYLHLIFAVWNINFDKLDFFLLEAENANLKLQGFLPYQTNKDHSQINCLHSPRNHQKKCYDPCLFGKGQSISKGLFVVFIWTKKRTKYFCHKGRNISFRFWFKWEEVDLHSKFTDL